MRIEDCRPTNVWLCTAPVIVTSALLVAPTALAIDYFSAEQAQRLIFPEATSFSELAVHPSAQQLADAARSARVSNHGEPRIWRASAADKLVGYVVIDEVIGKAEPITFAVGLLPDGTVKQVEILSYRETHGYEVRNARWRAQFAGKTATQPIAVGEDISNISGATLSCRHLADGIRRILALHHDFLANL
jgi:Na+-translocating ferredoxin:NAD+ oxidoreductase RnfG subunit